MLLARKNNTVTVAQSDNTCYFRSPPTKFPDCPRLSRSVGTQYLQPFCLYSVNNHTYTLWAIKKRAIGYSLIIIITKTMFMVL